MPYTILYPDNRPSDMGIEAEVTGSDVVFINPCKTRFEDVELSAWQNCDAIVVRRVMIDANVIGHLKRARIAVRMGVSVSAIEQLISRASERLTAAMEERP